MGIVVVVAWPTIVVFFFFVVVVVYYVASFGRRKANALLLFGAKQKHLEYRCAFRARARPTGIITTREKKCQKGGKNGKKKRIFFKFFHLGF